MRCYGAGLQTEFRGVPTQPTVLPFIFHLNYLQPTHLLSGLEVAGYVHGQCWAWSSLDSGLGPLLGPASHCVLQASCMEHQIPCGSPVLLLGDHCPTGMGPHCSVVIKLGMGCSPGTLLLGTRARCPSGCAAHAHGGGLWLYGRSAWKNHCCQDDLGHHRGMTRS